jgi:antitoxin (DNA-binding transcriptional repressor) of toxin-antitoxin stability system
MATVAVESDPKLADLLERVARGEIVRLTEGGAIVARLERESAAALDLNLDAATPAELVEHVRRIRADRRLGDEDIDALIDDGRP